MTYCPHGRSKQICLLCALNPTPTDVQLAQFHRHKKAGTTPGNPKWYKPQVVKPFEFKTGESARFPRLPTGAQWNASYSQHRARQFIVIRYKDGTSIKRLIGRS